MVKFITPERRGIYRWCYIHMKRSKINSLKEKLFKNLYVSNILTVFFIIVLIFTSGCGNNQKEIKIDLSKTQTGDIQFPQDDTDVVYFGFDLRLSPKEDVRIYIPFLQYLSEETGRTFKIHFTSEYDTTQDNLGKGITQFAALGALSYLKAHDEYGAVCLVRGLNAECKDKYRAAIVTHPDSDIKQIRDLCGKKFAFGSFYSTQGHLIPRKILEDADITLSDFEQYKYTDSHNECAKAVCTGECVAGGIQDTLAISLENEGKLKIIAFSDYYPSSGISANKDIDPAFREAVKKALLSFESKGKHQAILIDWHKTEMPCGFVEAEDKDYDELRKLAIEYGLIK